LQQACCSSPSKYDELKPEDIRVVVQKILERLYEFARKDYVPSYFMPTMTNPVMHEYQKAGIYNFFEHGSLSSDLRCGRYFEPSCLTYVFRQNIKLAGLEKSIFSDMRRRLGETYLLLLSVSSPEERRQVELPFFD
jgi:hypothetical protein